MNENQSLPVSPARLALLLAADKPIELLDVRTPPEFTNAHVPGASNFPVDDLDVETYLKQHQAGRSVYVLCQSGERALKAIEKFEDYGCLDCLLVEGGMQAWINAGLPVERGASKVIPVMRQVQIVVGTLSATGAALALLISPRFALLPVLIGCGLLFAGITGTCGMALLLARMPWNRAQSRCNDLFLSPR